VSATEKWHQFEIQLTSKKNADYVNSKYIFNQVNKTKPVLNHLCACPNGIMVDVTDSQCTLS